MPTGSCLCQKLRYEYQGDPLMKATCYCLSCRKITGGTTSLNLLFPEDKVRIIAGSSKQFTQMHESGKELTITFCVECGGTIYKTHELFPGHIIILAGTLDDPEGLEKSKPEQELFSKHRVSWLPGLSWADQKQEF